MHRVLAVLALFAFGCDEPLGSHASALSSSTGLVVTRVGPDVNGYRIVDGDVSYYLTDRYNAPLTSWRRYGGGRLQMREVRIRGERALAYAELDYSLQLSATMTSPRLWVGYQAGLESDLLALTVLVDGVDAKLDIGESVAAQSVAFRYATVGWLDPVADQRHRHPIVSWQVEREFTPGAARYSVRRELLDHACVWTEYAGTAGGAGQGGTLDGVRWDLARDASGELFGLGRRGLVSDYIARPASSWYELADSETGLVVRVDLDRAEPLQIGDHDVGSGNRVIGYAVPIVNPPESGHPGDVAEYSHTLSFREE